MVETSNDEMVEMIPVRVRISGGQTPRSCLQRGGSEIGKGTSHDREMSMTRRRGTDTTVRSIRMA